MTVVDFVPSAPHSAAPGISKNARFRSELFGLHAAVVVPARGLQSL